MIDNNEDVITPEAIKRMVKQLKVMKRQCDCCNGVNYPIIDSDIGKNCPYCSGIIRGVKYD